VPKPLVQGGESSARGLRCGPGPKEATAAGGHGVERQPRCGREAARLRVVTGTRPSPSTRRSDFRRRSPRLTSTTDRPARTVGLVSVRGSQKRRSCRARAAGRSPPARTGGDPMTVVGAALRLGAGIAEFAGPEHGPVHDRDRRPIPCQAPRDDDLPCGVRHEWARCQRPSRSGPRSGPARNPTTSTTLTTSDGRARSYHPLRPRNDRQVLAASTVRPDVAPVVAAAGTIVGSVVLLTGQPRLGPLVLAGAGPAARDTMIAFGRSPAVRLPPTSGRCLRTSALVRWRTGTPSSQDGGQAAVWRSGAAASNGSCKRSSGEAWSPHLPRGHGETPSLARCRMRRHQIAGVVGLARSALSHGVGRA
jgi:hypothetical protein